MDITWYGLSCFRITERSKTTILTDPYRETVGFAPGATTRADVITISHDAPHHNNVHLVPGEPYVLTGPGEYEIGGVFITGIALHTAAAESEGRYNVGYLLNYDGLTVMHMGDLAHVPDQSVVQDIGEVNVLLIPVGGGNALRAAQAAEVVALIEPNYIVPMHYSQPGLAFELDTADKFLKTMGVSSVNEEEYLRVSSSGLPEQPQVVLLQPQVNQ